MCYSLTPLSSISDLLFILITELHLLKYSENFQLNCVDRVHITKRKSCKTLIIWISLLYIFLFLEKPQLKKKTALLILIRKIKQITLKIYINHTHRKCA